MPDKPKLTKSQFIKQAQAGEFDNEPWYASAVRQLFEPIPAVQDRAADIATGLDPDHQLGPGTFGIEDIPSGLRAIPDIIKHLSGVYGYTPKGDFNSITDANQATVKGGAAGVIEASGDNLTPMDIMTATAGKVLKSSKGVIKVADKAGEAIEGLTKGKLSLEERIANLFKDDPLHPSTAGPKVTPTGPPSSIDSRISGILDNPATPKGVGIEHPSPVRQAELASGRPTVKPKLSTDTDTRVKELLDKLGGTRTPTVSAAADEPWLHDTVRPRSAELDAFTSPSSGRLQSEGVKAAKQSKVLDYPKQMDITYPNHTPEERAALWAKIKQMNELYK